jgi:type IV pilus assembly protein PilY1
MFRRNSKSTAAFAGLALGVIATLPALADDLEIFRSQSLTEGVLPNVLFIMDSSGSMSTLVSSPRPPYDPRTVYSGSCTSGKIYYVAGSTVPATPPRCSGTSPAPSFNESVNTCDAMTTAFAANNSFFQDVAAQYRSVSGTNRWRTISTSSDPVECKTDNGMHGQTAGATEKYIQENTSQGWTAAVGNDWGQSGGSGATAFNTSTSYIFYTANYLNWANQSASAYQETRLEIMQRVSKDLANSLNNVNIGLMRYNNPPGSGDTQGGSVLQAVDNISTNRIAFNAAIDGIVASGNTPLTETLYEAYLYFSGRGVLFGNNAPTSVAASRTGGNTYKSPIEFQCQKNYIVYLTDGLPTTDTSANAQINSANLPGFNYLSGGTCGAAPGSSGNGGQCMDDLAGYMAKQNTDLLSSVAGNQNVFTYMIGFGGDPQLATTGTPYLNSVARAGGTSQSYTAADADALTATLQQIFTSIQQTNSTFVTPAISVNAFNKAQTQNDLFFTVFKPELGLHWPGNLKKYKLGTLNGETTILDSLNAPAVGPNGFFATGTTSIWSQTADGPDATAGGAANLLKAPAARNLYTDVAGSALATPSNALTVLNLNVTNAMLGLSPLDAAGRAVAIGWARGADVDDEDNDGDILEQVAVPYMGDPLHGRPAIVTYGGSTASPDANDSVVYVPTNDGFLHAINGRTDTASGGGQELWAFIPQQLLYRLTQLHQNPETANRTYGLDGNIQVLQYDANHNGIIESGDRVWLYFGMRMGQDVSGRSYYFALDVTDRDRPVVSWVLGPSELPGLGQTWSTPTIARVNVGPGGIANDNAQKYVLIFGGGYDMAAETPTNTVETVGNRIFMVDAETGKLLWTARPGPGDNATGTFLELTKMTNAIPGDITVLDTDGDGLADRMYTADLGGRIWRFDIFNGNTSGNPLVTGGALAQLGRGNVAGSTQADNRRFYNGPDVALVQRRGISPYFNIAIGSGYRAHPLDASITDRFFAVRDKAPFAHWTQAMYSGATPVLDADLVDITSSPGTIPVPAASPGWKLSMTLHGSGEKILGESTTISNVILFTSFQPGSPDPTSPCLPTNINRAYAVTIGSGAPALDFNEDGIVNATDLSFDLQQQGIVGEVNVAFLRDGDGSDDGNNNNGGSDEGSNEGATCQVGAQILPQCPGENGVIRTFWERNDGQ